MPVVERSAIVPFRPDQMYRLIIDVEAYPEFLPWCSDSRQLSWTEDRQCAEIQVSRLGVSQRFSTCNRLVPDRSVEINLDEGPFKQLEGHSHLTPLADKACKIELLLRFEMSGALINKDFGEVFAQVANTLVESFCKRAEELYG